MDPSGPAALERRKHRVDLMSERGHEHEVVGSLFVQRVDDSHRDPRTRPMDDRLVSLQLRKPCGAATRDDGHVMAGTSEVVRELFMRGGLTMS